MKPLTAVIARLCSSPASDVGVADPSATARNVVPGPIAASVRSSHPDEAVSEPPFSSHCWAWKWLRLMPVDETAGTKASSPVDHSPSYSGLRLSLITQPPLLGSAI